MSSVADSRSQAGRRLSRTESQTVRQVRSAIKKGDIANLQNLLVDPELCIDSSFGGATALHLAASLHSEKMVQLLLSAGACPEGSADDDGNTLLHQMVKQGKLNIIRMLIEAGADIETSNVHGSTLINSAAELGLHEVVKELIDADCGINRPNLRGKSPLASAAMNGHLEIVKQLISAECDIHWKDNERKNALMVAIEAGQLDVAKFLITAGCDLDAVDQYGRTALYLASELGQLDIVRALINSKANINRADTRGCTPFTEAVANRNMDVAEALLQAGCDINIAKYENREVPIHSAIKLSASIYGQREFQLGIVKWLLKEKCDVNVADKDGWTPLFHAAYGGEAEIVKLLLDRNADVTKVTRTKDSVLHGSIYGNSSEVLSLLIKAGCLVNCVNEKNELPLYTAIDRRADNEIIRLLLEAGSLTDVCERKTHQSPLFVAIQQKYTEAVDLLIKAGCDVNLQNRDGNTPLWVACTTGCEEIVRILLSHPKIIVNQGVQQGPLHAAATFGYRGIVQMLLEAGCDVNRLSDVGVSAFFVAADKNHFSVAQLLVQWGANPSIVHLIEPPARCCLFYDDEHPHLELEPLFAAVENDNFRMVKLILTATPQMPYKVLTTLRDLLFRTDYAQEARLSQQAILHYAQFFVGILSQPRSLKEECRGIIRQFLGNNPTAKVDGLMLPVTVKEYILLSDCPIMKA